MLNVTIDCFECLMTDKLKMEFCKIQWKSKNNLIVLIKYCIGPNTAHCPRCTSNWQYARRKTS